MVNFNEPAEIWLNLCRLTVAVNYNKELDTVITEERISKYGLREDRGRRDRACLLST
jgi:hypothetical protein